MPPQKTYLDTHDRMDRYQPHAKSSLEPWFLKLLRVEHRGKLYDGADVWGIDGYLLRLPDVDFTTGGNPARYRYVPPGEIWVERFLSPPDVAAVYVHEGYETARMKFDGILYDNAHDEANIHEHTIRRALWAGKIVINSYPEALQFANMYLTQVLKELR